MRYKQIAPLHDYQKQAARHVIQGKGNALFLEMGLGKTLTTLEILGYRMHKGRTQSTLIIAPKRICDQVWRQEVEKWGYPFSVCRLNGSAKERLAKLENPQHDVYLLTYELVIWLRETGLFPFDTVVLDELSRMKNSGSKRWRAFKSLLIEFNPWVLGLTGTPAPNGYPDLWAQMYCLDRGATLGDSKGKFLNKHFLNISKEPRKYAKWAPRPGELQQINQRLLDAGVISMTAAEVLGQRKPIRLPSVYVEMPVAANRIYSDLENELMATMPDGRIVLPEHAAVVSMKLRQVSSGFMLDDEGTAHRLHVGKIAALDDLLQEADGEPLLVVYTYVEELRMIREYFGHVPYLGGGTRDSDASAWIAAWNRRELPMLCVQPQSAGHGLNLQAGGHNIVFYSADWNLETYQQVVARLDRQGQTAPVFIRHLVGGEVEDQITQRLAEKAGVQEGLMVALQKVK
ncbi:MAG: DEAD/DEAH box helicase [Halioglobus sp.]